jgi:hypothetical protein
VLSQPRDGRPSVPPPQRRAVSATDGTRKTVHVPDHLVSARQLKLSMFSSEQFRASIVLERQWNCVPCLTKTNASNSKGRHEAPPSAQVPAPNRRDFYFASDRGRLGHPRVYTVGLHRPNPVALEKPYSIGFFASQLSLAEREGFSAPLRDPRKTASKSTFSGQPRQAVCTGSMYRNRRLSSSGFERMVNAFPPSCTSAIANRLAHQ